MSNWKVFIAFCCSIIFVSAYSQNGKLQQFSTALSKGRYFESKELYPEIDKALDLDEDLYYKYRMYGFMNKKDSVAVCLEKMLEDYPEFIGNNAIVTYMELFNIYAELKDYEKGIYAYKRILEHLEDNPYDINEEKIGAWKKNIEESFAYFKQVVNEPPIKVRRKEVADTLKIEGSERLRFEARFNGILHKTLFDTGVNTYCLMSKRYADKMGINYNKAEVRSEPINEMNIPVMRVLLDSIEIGNVTLYNVPIKIYDYTINFCLPDSVKNDTLKMKSFESGKNDLQAPIIGLPTMQLMRKLLIDYEKNYISFPQQDIKSERGTEPNLFFFYDGLFTQIKLNGVNFTGYLDTGFDNYIEIDSLFYDKHKDDIPIDNSAEKKSYHIAMFHQFWVDIPYKTSSRLIITFNKKPMTSAPDSPIKIYALQSMWPAKLLDGVVGYEFFKKIGRKVLLDFDNMRLEAIE